MPDNYSMWESKEREHDRWLKTRPICCECEEHIQDERCFEFDGKYICERCLEQNHRKWTEDCV